MLSMRMRVAFRKQLGIHWPQNSSTSSTANFSSKIFCRMTIIFLAHMVIPRTWLIWPLLIMPLGIECRTKDSRVIVVPSHNLTHNLEHLTNTQIINNQCQSLMVLKSTWIAMILHQIQISLLTSSLQNRCKEPANIKHAISVNHQRKIKIHHNSCLKCNCKTN